MYLLKGLSIGNKHYVYDGVSGTIFSTSKELSKHAYAIRSSDRDSVITALLNLGLKRSTATKIYVEFFNNLREHVSDVIDISDIAFYQQSSLDVFPNSDIIPEQIVFCITENCNLRCSYCCYNDNYNLTRGISTKSMPISIIQAVVDYLPTPQVKEYTFGFYGGEPLLEFDLIQRAVCIIQKKFPLSDFSMTTNGTLLTRDVVDYLVAKKFYLTISVDVNQDIHDRNRRFQDGAPTYNLIINNLEYMKLKYPDHYSSHTQFRATILDPNDWVTVDKSTNLNISTTSTVCHNSDDTMTIPEMSEESKAILDASYRLVHDELLQCSPESILSLSSKAQDLFKVLSIIHCRIANSNHLHLGGICNPPGGRKLYVDSHGDFYICEKVDYALKIGSYLTWIDKDLVNKIIIDFVSFKLKHCSFCWVNKLCSLCFSSLLNNTGFVIHNNECNTERIKLENSLKLYIEIIEAGKVDLLDGISKWINEKRY